MSPSMKAPMTDTHNTKVIRVAVLVTADRGAGMGAGWVVGDLAADSAHNVEGVIAGRDILVPVPGGAVTLVGMQDAASAVASDASRLYAKTVANLLALMTLDGKVVPDFDDDVVAGACLTHDGAVRHAGTAAAMEAHN